jgi:hypothetical protein
MPMNDGIVNLLISVTLQDTTSPKPLTPLFTVFADSQPTAPNQQSFSCSGLGDNDQDLLKDILRKIINSYPTSPISLCVSGADILPDAQCVVAPKKAARKKAEHKKAAPKKSAPKKAALKATTAKKTGARSGGPPKVAKKPVKKPR